MTFAELFDMFETCFGILTLVYFTTADESEITLARLQLNQG